MRCTILLSAARPNANTGGMITIAVREDQLVDCVCVQYRKNVSVRREKNVIECRDQRRRNRTLTNRGLKFIAAYTLAGKQIKENNNIITRDCLKGRAVYES